MSTYAYLDFCFFERCNLACDYCRKDNSGVAAPPSLDAFDRALTRFLVHSRAAVFKVSGYGEALLWPHVVEVLSKYNGAFPTMQLMTNGTAPPGRLERLAEIPNLSFCTTIDGPDLDSNRHRSHHDPKLHTKMFQFVDLIVGMRKQLEINCVITRSNIDHLFAFAQFLRDRYGPSLRLIPFPVRPFIWLATADLFPSQQQVSGFGTEYEQRYDGLLDILPPRQYMERLLAFLRGRKRTAPCHIAVANYGIGPSLQPLICACSGHSRPSQNKTNVLRVVTRPAVSRLRYSRGSVDVRCSRCFNHYELLNLFLEGAYSAETLAGFGAFAFPGVKDTLEQMKSEIFCDCSKVTWELKDRGHYR